MTDAGCGGAHKWLQNKNAQFTDAISANVKLDRNGQRLGQIRIYWDDGEGNAVARLTGMVNGSRVEARRIAP